MTAIVPQQRPAATSDHAPGWELVERAQAGDRDAFGELYAKHHPLVLRFVDRRVANRALAEDLAADVFVRALRSLGSVTYRGSHIGAWFTTIARNTVADYYKSGWYRTEFLVDEFFELDGVDIDAGPEQIVTGAMIGARVRSAVTALRGEQRRCIELRFYLGQNLAETAAAMGRSEGAVKALQRRAVQAVARSLNGELPEMR